MSGDETIARLIAELERSQPDHPALGVLRGTHGAVAWPCIKAIRVMQRRIRNNEKTALPATTFHFGDRFVSAEVPEPPEGTPDRPTLGQQLKMLSAAPMSPEDLEAVRAWRRFMRFLAIGLTEGEA